MVYWLKKPLFGKLTNFDNTIGQLRYNIVG
jgi:hypothetical protein